MHDSPPSQAVVPVSSDQAYPVYGSMQAYPAQAPQPRLKRYLKFLARFWWLPTLTLLLGAGVGAAVLHRLPPTFTSKASMWQTERLQLPEGAAFMSEAQNYLGTQLEALKSGRMWQLALARLQASGTNAVPLDSEGNPPEVDIKVSQAPKGAVFIIEAISAKGDYAQSFLNALLTEYLAYKKNLRKVVGGDTASSIYEQVQSLERNLKNDQDVLAAFQRTNNLAILQEEATVAGGYLTRLKTQLSDLQLEAQILDTAMPGKESPEGSATNNVALLAESLRAGSSSSPSAALAERQAALKEVQMLKAQRDKLSQTLRPKHPKIAKLNADIERGEHLLQMYQSQTRDQLGATRQALQMRVDNVQGSIREWERKVIEANARIAEAEALRLNVVRSQTVYERLASLLQNVDISRNIDQEPLAILENASAPKRTYKQEIQFGALSLIAGLALGLGLVFLIEVRDDRFDTFEETRNHFPEEIIGQLPEITLKNGQKRPAILEPDDQRHIFAESCRSLRSSILFRPINGTRPKTILVTSAAPGEGKSTVAVNLARAMAFGGSSVLLIDADLRRGHLHDLVGLPNEIGLSELLSAGGQPNRIIRPTSLPKLCFLGRGRSDHASSELFLAPAFDSLLDYARSTFDYIVLDAIPVFAADDTTTLAPRMDATLFVVRRRHTSAAMVNSALELLYQRQAKILGFVFNGAKTTDHAYYYYKYAPYHQNGKKQTA